MPKSYKFDFNAEVARAREEYPQLSGNTLFVDTSAPGAEKSVRDCLRDKLLQKTMRNLESAKAEFKDSLERARAGKTPAAKIRHTERKFKKEYRAARRHIMASIGRTAKKILGKRNFMQSSPSNPGYFLVGVHAKKSVSGLIDSAMPEKEKFFAFWHEVGHRVVKGGYMADVSGGAAKHSAQHAHNEKCADAFALLQGFRRGVLNEKDAKKLALNRICDALACSDTEHLTAVAVNRAAGRNIRAMRSRTPRQIAKSAQDIAARYRAKAGALKKIAAVNAEFYATCDAGALAQFRKVSRKEAKTAMESLRQARKFRENIVHVFSALAARAKRGSVERQYCDSILKAVKAASTPRT